MEIWKEIIPGYEISNHGNCRGKTRVVVDKRGFSKSIKERTLGRHFYSGGYQFYHISNKGHLIHRLVAISFIPNPENKRCVNHKDGDKTNNHVDNLEWMTHSENHKHAYQKLGRKSHWSGKSGRLHGKSRPVEMLDDDGSVLATYPSVKDASNAAGKRFGAVGKAIREGYRINGRRYRFSETRDYKAPKETWRKRMKRGANSR